MSLYEQFQEDESCSVAIQPYTGEVLALVSTPSYDSNDFVLGLSDGQWEALSGDERQPLYNRFRQVWCRALRLSRLRQPSVWNRERSIRQRIMEARD